MNATATALPKRMRRMDPTESQPTLRQRIATIVHSDPGVTAAEHDLARLEGQADELRADLKVPPTQADPWRHDGVRQKLAALEPELSEARKKLSEARQRTASNALELFRAERGATVSTFRQHLQGLIDSARAMVALADVARDAKLPIKLQDSLAGASDAQRLIPQLEAILRMSLDG